MSDNIALNRIVSRAGIESIVAPQPVETDTTCAREQAALRIQALIRGFLARKSLPPQIRVGMESGKLMRTTGYIEHIPAAGGNTPVWLPKAYPGIIMKFSGGLSRSRLEQMNSIREVLEIQGGSHAIVPIARKGERNGQTILVEERLPVNIDQYYNMWLYLHNWKAFDNVVRELVRLYSERGGLGDLRGKGLHPLTQLKGSKGGIRFDNFPLYLNKEGEGCVGLIDLEHMGTQTFLSACQTLTRIFPFQIDLILDEAEKCGHDLKKYSLELYAQQGKRALEAGIQRHEEWLWKKTKTEGKWIDLLQMDVLNPITFLTRSRKKNLITLVKQMLLKAHEKRGEPESSNLYRIKYTSMMPWRSEDQPPLPSSFFYNPLDTGVDVNWMLNPGLTLSRQEISADTLATGITLFILQYFENALPKEGRRPSFKTCKKGREWEVIRDRSPTIEYSQLLCTIERMIEAHQRLIKGKFIFLEGEEVYFPYIRTGKIVDTIMKDLISHGDIFSCDAITGGYYWLRY